MKLPLIPQGVFSRIAVLLFALLFLMAGFQYALLVSLWNRALSEQEQILHWDVADDIARQLGPLTEDDLKGESLARRLMELKQVNPRIEPFLLGADGAVKFPERFRSYRGKPQYVDVATLEQFLQPTMNRTLPLKNLDPVRPTEPVIFSVAPVSIDGKRHYLYVLLANQEYRLLIRGVEIKYVVYGGLLSGIGIATCLALLGVFLLSKASSRLRAVISTVHAFAEGSQEARVASPHRDEIGQLGAEFNQMADAIVAHVDEVRSRDQQRRELIAGIAHDVGAPLSIVSGQLERVLEDQSTLLNADQVTRLKSAQLSVGALRKLIQQLSDLSTLEESDAKVHLEDFSIADLITEEILPKYSGISAEKQIVIRTDLPARLPFVTADPVLMERVFSNLVENALRYAGGGSEIRIGAELRENDIQISVADTGAGIPPEEQQKIFERFYRGKDAVTQAEGSGLGLVIVKQILSLHRQKITLRSTVGQGTCFAFFLPVAKKPSTVRTDVT